jgi:hypothetical protein
MINTSSGGGGLPPSPERDKEVEPNAKEVADSRFPEKNLTGSEKLEKPGAAANKVAGADISENTFQGSKDPLSTVPEGNVDGEIQDVEMSEPVEAETAGKQDTADDYVSLAAGHDNMTPLSLSQANEEQRPPCHQPSGTSDKEESLEEGEADDEMPTVVPSDGNSINMLLYQMKLLTFKKKATASLMKIIKTMLMIDKRMAIEQFDSQNEAFKDKPICCFEDLPETEDEMAAYFPSVHDMKNKDGMSIVF